KLIIDKYVKDEKGDNKENREKEIGKESKKKKSGNKDEGEKEKFEKVIKYIEDIFRGRRTQKKLFLPKNSPYTSIEINRKISYIWETLLNSNIDIAAKDLKHIVEIVLKAVVHYFINEILAEKSSTPEKN